MVTPPAAAARVAVWNPSHSVLPGSFTCTWESIIPGINTNEPQSLNRMPGYFWNARRFAFSFCASNDLCEELPVTNIVQRLHRCRMIFPGFFHRSRPPWPVGRCLRRLLFEIWKRIFVNLLGSACLSVHRREITVTATRVIRVYK